MDDLQTTDIDLSDQLTVYESLPEQHRTFVDHFIFSGGNATTAARAANIGGDRPDQYGAELLTRKNIQTALENRLAAEARAQPASLPYIRAKLTAIIDAATERPGDRNGKDDHGLLQELLGEFAPERDKGPMRAPQTAVKALELLARLDGHLMSLHATQNIDARGARLEFTAPPVVTPEEWSRQRENHSLNQVHRQLPSSARGTPSSLKAHVAPGKRTLSLVASSRTTRNIESVHDLL